MNKAQYAKTKQFLDDAYDAFQQAPRTDSDDAVCLIMNALSEILKSLKPEKDTEKVSP